MTNPGGRSALGGLWNSIQSWLFPMLEDEIGELDEKHRHFVAVCELCAPQDHMHAYRWIGNGSPPKDRLALCKAFIAKAAWDFPTTRDLIDAVRHRPALRRLCGWETLGEVPTEATFSRAFAAFAQDGLPQRIHEAMLKTHQLHLDTIDGDIPVSAILSSASLHDSQVAIPLAQMTATRVRSLYDLADAAYDATEIRAMSARLGHVALIDHNPRRGEKREFSPAEAVRRS